ncbi:DUF2303 family protein [Cellvibrio mixtus]|uniref:DUF2303 family protein n=1 Tax=Cellvibrio mixtus TaxID=39650 RepID=UPI0005868BED|nr:DUF2303 family protein [Cellvibrio mixtus]
MSLDSSAIQEIRKADAVATANEAITKRLASNAKPVAVVPQDFSLVELEKFQPKRSRFRGQMNTTVINDFVAFVKAHQVKGESTGFIDPDKMTAKVFFNLGDANNPGHGDFTSVLSLDKSAELRALLNTANMNFSQKQFAEWIEDWVPNLEFLDSEGDILETRKVISAVRRVTIESSRKEDHEAQDFKATKSALESIEAKSESALPSLMKFTCIPYSGLDEQTFECRIALITAHEAPIFKIAIRQLETMQETISENFLDILNDRFVETDLELYRGKLEI